MGKTKSAASKTIRVEVGVITAGMLAKLRCRGDVTESTLHPPRRGFNMTPATLQTLKKHPEFKHVFGKKRNGR